MSNLAHQASEVNKTIGHMTKEHIEGIRQIGQEVQGMTHLSQEVTTSLTPAPALAEHLQAQVEGLSHDLNRYRL